MRGALFGTLGWNIISLGLHPPAGMSGGGWLFTGVMFWLMAAGGLIPVMWAAVGWLRRGGQPQPFPSPLNPWTVRAMMQLPPRSATFH